MQEGWELKTIVMEDRDKISEVWLSQWRYLGAIGHRSMPPNKHSSNETGGVAMKLEAIGDVYELAGSALISQG